MCNNASKEAVSVPAKYEVQKPYQVNDYATIPMTRIIIMELLIIMKLIIATTQKDIWKLREV